MAKKKLVDGVEQVADATKQKERDAERRARFVKHAERRVRRAMKCLRSVARMSNHANYSYYADEANAITEAISSAATDVLEAFNGTARREAEFTLFHVEPQS